MCFGNSQVQNLLATTKGYFYLTLYVCHEFSLLDTQVEGEAPIRNIDLPIAKGERAMVDHVLVLKASAWKWPMSLLIRP